MMAPAVRNTGRPRFISLPPAIASHRLLRVRPSPIMVVMLGYYFWVVTLQLIFIENERPPMGISLVEPWALGC